MYLCGLKKISPHRYIVNIEWVCLLVFLTFLSFQTNAAGGDQDTSKLFNPKRAKIAGISLGVTYAVSMTGLYQLWYKDYPSSKFHFFDDKNEWERMDKLGHIGSSYYISRWCNNIISWTGTNNKRSALIGTGISFLYLSTIEMFDAYSSNWGFSVSDVVANTAGCGLFLGQELLWNEQRMQVKFSYVNTRYPRFRPDELGSSGIENVFKDYNGQTYWLSINIHSFLPESSRFPKWLNIAGGIGADGMVTAYEQVFEIDQVIFPERDRILEYYIGPDIDLTKILPNSKVMKAIGEVFGFIKFPLPAIKWSERGRPNFLKFGF